MPNNAAHVMRLVCPEEAARAVADVVVEMFDPADAAASAFELEPHTRDWSTGDWIVEVYFADAPDEQMVHGLVSDIAGEEIAGKIAFGRIEEKDWVSSSMEGLEPVRAGRFLVHGSHDRGKAGPNDIAIEIEAALAFGTGHHGTTRGCLMMLDDILKQRRPRAVLDIGTGTGVLAIAAARFLHRPVVASDIDPVAVDAARENAVLNGAGAWVHPLVATGTAHPAIQAGAFYDLIFANILAKPLRAMAPSIARVAASEAELVLSGLLARDVPGVLTAYAAQGFALVKRRDLEGWASLLMRKGGAARRAAGRHIHLD